MRVATLSGALLVGVPTMQGTLLKLSLPLEQMNGTLCVVHLWPPRAPTWATLPWRWFRSVTFTLYYLNLVLSVVFEWGLTILVHLSSLHLLTAWWQLLTSDLTLLFVTCRWTTYRRGLVQQIPRFLTMWLRLR